MDFSITEDQTAIKELAYQIFTDQATDESLLALARSEQHYDDNLWRILAEQGLLGLSLPEAVGGSGLGFTELCLMLEEQGRRVAPVPLFASLVLGASPIVDFGTEEQQKTYLSPLATGDKKLSAAIAELAMNPAVVTAVNATEQGEGWQLNGSVSCVQDGAIADFVLVPAVTDAKADDGKDLSVFIVDVAQGGVTVTPQQLGLLGEWNATMTMSDVTQSKATLLGELGQGREIIERLEQCANIAHCAMQTGVSEEAMTRTAQYTTERKQFGVAIGSFQALAMRMADSYIDVEAIRSTYWLALWRFEQGLDARAEVRAAKFWACEGAHRVVHTAQHLHGGIGADVEYPIHRFFLWSKMISYSLGGGSRQLQELGALLASDDALGLTALEAQ